MTFQIKADNLTDGEKSKLEFTFEGTGTEVRALILAIHEMIYKLGSGKNTCSGILHG